MVDLGEAGAHVFKVDGLVELDGERSPAGELEAEGQPRRDEQRGEAHSDDGRGEHEGEPPVGYEFIHVTFCPAVMPSVVSSLLVLRSASPGQLSAGVVRWGSRMSAKSLGFPANGVPTRSRRMVRLTTKAVNTLAMIANMRVIAKPITRGSPS